MILLFKFRIFLAFHHKILIWICLLLLRDSGGMSTVQLQFIWNTQSKFIETSKADWIYERVYCNTILLRTIHVLGSMESMRTHIMATNVWCHTTLQHTPWTLRFSIPPLYARRHTHTHTCTRTDIVTHLYTFTNVCMRACHHCFCTAVWLRASHWMAANKRTNVWRENGIKTKQVQKRNSKNMVSCSI